jgi:hypothetical protein
MMMEEDNDSRTIWTPGPRLKVWGAEDGEDGGLGGKREQLSCSAHFPLTLSDAAFTSTKVSGAEVTSSVKAVQNIINEQAKWLRRHLGLGRFAEITAILPLSRLYSPLFF